jgi:hypothetical protein
MPNIMWQNIIGMAIYPIAATLLIWTGIGCVQKRRWVRPIVLIFASFGLLMGIVAFLSTCLTIPAISKAAATPTPVPFVLKTSKVVTTSTTLPTTAPVVTTTMPPPVMGPIIAGMVVTTLLFGLGIPLTFLLLFRGQHVRNTLEFYDPNWRWTEACPIPVLGLAIAMLIAALTIPMSALIGVMFLFGVPVSGIPLFAAITVVTVLLVVTAWQVYRIKFIGWIIAIVMICIGSASWITTLFRTPVEEIYRASGLTAQQIEYSSQFRNPAMTGAVSIVWSALAIGFILYTRRFFPGGRQFTAETPTSIPPIET